MTDFHSAKATLQSQSDQLLTEARHIMQSLDEQSICNLHDSILMMVAAPPESHTYQIGVLAHLAFCDTTLHVANLIEEDDNDGL